MLDLIKSYYFTKTFFSYVDERQKLKIVKCTKSLQKRLDITLLNYKFFKGKYIIYENETNRKGREYDQNDILVYEGEYLNGERNGKGKEYHEDGKLEFEGEYKNGKRNGKGEEYSRNGELLFEGEYKDGILLSCTIYDDNGNIIHKKNKVDDNEPIYFKLIRQYFFRKKNGKDKEYNYNGKLLYEGEFLNDKRHGIGKEYYDEKLKFEGEYLYGWKVKGKFYINDKLRYEGEYLLDKFYNGKGYDENGNVIFELKNGNGKVIEYYDNGNIKFEGEYLNGKKHGKGKEYNREGKLNYDGEYLNGKKNGKGKEYNTYNGNLLFEGEYLNGKRYGHGKEYNFMGKLIYEGEYPNGK